MSNRSRIGFRRMNRSLAAIAAEEGLTSANLLAATTQSPDPVYGNGSDGDLTFDGTTTVLSIAPSSSTYTLTRDIYAANMTINANVKVITNGYRVFVRNVLAMNSGSILGFETGSSATGSISGGGAANSAVTTSLGGSFFDPGGHCPTCKYRRDTVLVPSNECRAWMGDIRCCPNGNLSKGRCWWDCSSWRRSGNSFR